MPSITHWTRLEPRLRNIEMTDGLAARVHDPLWFLARQWQLGELLGEDAGSPVSVRVQVEHTPLTRFYPGPLPAEAMAGQPFDGRHLPLETLAEREAITQEPDRMSTWRFAVDAGQHFLRLLEQFAQQAYRGAYLTHYALTPPAENVANADPAAQRFVLLMAGRVPDGLALRAALQAALHPPGGGPGQLPTQPAIAVDDQPAMRQVAEAFLVWCNTFFSEPDATAQDAWVDSRMEYAFSVGGHGASGEAVLNAAEYTDGSLDWYAFDRLPNRSIGAEQDAPGAVLTHTAIPSPVTYRGMPAVRWWELEDATVDFGAVEATPVDLARLLLVEFAVVYANDWFLLPLPLPVGGLYRTRSLVVTDTFGERRLLRPYTEVDAPGASWRLFHLSGSADPDLFLAPTLPASLEGQAVEEVLLLRDEMANLAWAVERQIPGPHGRPVDRHEIEAARRAHFPPAEPAFPAALAYHLATPVPEHWIPLVPVRDDPSEPLRLRRALLLHGGPEGLTEPAPQGRILLPRQPLDLHEEEVPRTGARVTRAYQYSRAADGSPHLWLARRKSPGRGEGFSGLRFDVVEEIGLAAEASGNGTFDSAHFDTGGRFA